MRHLAAALVAMALLAVPAAADRGGGAAALARARAHLDAVELELARAALEEALAAGDSGPAELAEIHLLAGRVAAALGKEGDAVAAFGRLLALDPAAALPPGLAPKIVAPFEEARERARGARLRLRAELRESAEPRLLVTVESDPLAMVAGARAVIAGGAGGEQTVAVAGRRHMTLRLPPGGSLRVALAVVDRHGNRLAEARFAAGAGAGDPRLTATVVRPLEPARPAPAPRTPLHARWYLWAGASAALLATGTYFALAAGRTGDQLDDWANESGRHDASDALALDDRGRRQTLLANIGFAAGAATAAVATFLAWRF
ncbi:MAG TPA: hypothetical protein VFU21_08030 [Kofleriaceae bacterium]|nr:hypothetical protein [Kofleriaceae bacterium]